MVTIYVLILIKNSVACFYRYEGDHAMMRTLRFIAL